VKIAFISLYNNYVTGCRAIGAYLKRLGHDIRFIHLKAQYRPLIPYSELERVRGMRRESPYLGVMNYEEGYVCAPTHVPISELEEEILVEELRRDPPDVVGFAPLWSEVSCFRRIGGLVRHVLPGVPIVAGGVSVISQPEFFLTTADVVCTGEGEETISEWLRDISRTDIDGLWFRKNGSLIRNPDRPKIENLDSLPIPLYGENEVLIEENALSRKLEKDLYYLGTKWTFMSSRDCPMNCSYCFEGRRLPREPKRRPRRRSVDHFIAEIREAVGRLPYPRLQIWDSIFVRDEEWLEEFADKYRNQIGLPFDSNGFPGLTTRRALDLVKRAGSDETIIGLQGGTERTLKKFYDRNTTPEAVRRTIRDGFEAGFERMSCDLIINSPYETEEGLSGTFDLLMSFPKPVTVFLNQLIRFPGTPIADIPPPGPELPEEVHRFWNALFLLTQYREIDEGGLRAMAADCRLREHPEIVEGFLAGYVRRHNYLGRPIHARYANPHPGRRDVGRWPSSRLFAQKYFPRGYARLMLWKRRAGKLTGKKYGTGKAGEAGRERESEAVRCE
jgi:radical SAM superfamily enzyme YgiQ (UPF0313 family)